MGGLYLAVSESFTIAYPRCGSDEIQRGCEMSENNTTKSTGRRQRVQANRRNVNSHLILLKKFPPPGLQSF
jgi:hypothetical protein